MGKPTKSIIYTQNEFLGSVVEKIGRQQYSSRAYQNPLAQFKKGFIENANEIEEIYVARVQGVSQDFDGVDTLKRVKPSIQTQYHKQNFGKCYTATVTDQQVRRGFTNEGGVRKIADEILTQLRTGYEYDEYVAMRDNFCDLISDSPSKTVVADVVDTESAKAFVKQVKKHISEMKFRGTKFATVERHCLPSDLMLVLKTGVLAEIDVELLASAFNVSKTELDTMVVEVDSFPNAPTVIGMLLEKDALMVFDTLYNIEPQRNAKGMFTNHHLNVEKIISTSNMYNVAVYSTSALTVKELKALDKAKEERNEK